MTMLAGWSILRGDVYLFYLASKELSGEIPRSGSSLGTTLLTGRKLDFVDAAKLDSAGREKRIL
jgi:hypothetical protein